MSTVNKKITHKCTPKKQIEESHKKSRTRSTVYKRKNFLECVDLNFSRWRQKRSLEKLLVYLMVFNTVAYQNHAAEVFTSRMLASLLGYPTTCMIGQDVKSCTLTINCWLRGGTRAWGCGNGWLFSCCLGPEDIKTEVYTGELVRDDPYKNEELDNNIPSSEWKHKVSPPVLRKVPRRSVVPNNAFRRRADGDSEQAMIRHGHMCLYYVVPPYWKYRIYGQERFLNLEQLSAPGNYYENPLQDSCLNLDHHSARICGDCGLPSNRILQKRIIGGREARFAEFPWQAHVRISEFQCGGVLVSRRYVATAAHCVSRAHPREIFVWLGAHDTSIHTENRLGITQKILHPLFQFRMTQPDRYDVALLRLSRPITYMSHILPICLPDYGIDLRGKLGIIAGWGKTDASNGHTGTNLLRSATVPILSTEQCIKWHKIKQISVEIHSEMICAGHSDGHQDACLGDSGGPLIVPDSGRYYLVGITSAGFGCGVDHQPGIYHNVMMTSKWIKKVINSPSVNYIDF